MQQILLVEDTVEYQKIIQRALGSHQIAIVDTVEAAIQYLRNNKVDLILLDINLPKQSGYSLFSELSNSELEVPVICITGKADVTDKVTAFSLGAEDYIVKPFDPIELKARVDGKLNKNKKKDRDSSLQTIDDLEINLLSHRVMINTSAGKKEVVLTQTEFKLLSCLVRHPDRVYTRDQLLVAAWGEDAHVLDRVVDVHLCSLRKKLTEHSHYIKAVPGVGYKFSIQKQKKAA